MKYVGFPKNRRRLRKDLFLTNLIHYPVIKRLAEEIARKEDEAHTMEEKVELDELLKKHTDLISEEEKNILARLHEDWLPLWCLSLSRRSTQNETTVWTRDVGHRP
ncbi:hypothetical protein MLD38_035618 [Melastoma candidum]|uniref:Uncharacterized protein n=1 Tax=Melastoma candidum TaxID=119954 RepID=A0ACB9LHE3_9MYRT|nr:hypothetical protein MLD38_035618 [Melastoma candidum]